MVKRRLSKKYTKEETDESDSDDFYEEPSVSDSRQKKYSLRQRRGTNFAEDFDYDVVDELDANVGSTINISKGDEEFSPKEDDNDEEDFLNDPQTSTNRKLIDNKQKNENITNCTITKYKDRELEPEIPKDKQSVDDMIDFEDVIRADILVNKNRIDYDSIIEKTEIKIEKRTKVEKEPPEKTKASPVKTTKLNKNGEPPKKRGRKPKKPEFEIDYETSVHESETVGLPINTVLGVTESLYELAERYHMQSGSILMESLPVEPILENMNAADEGENYMIENENMSTATVQESEAVTEAIETF